MVQPIRPEEVYSHKTRLIPEYVIKCFNDLIICHWNGQEARIAQDDVIKEICAVGNIPRTLVFSKHYLDVEPIFEDAGWIVKYDKPGYGDFAEASYTFSKKNPS